jgi:hypothetical protein
MKTGFSPIRKSEFIDKHIKSNPSESKKNFTRAIDSALNDYKNGVKCDCGNSIWVIGSAVAGNACFTCITHESTPDKDYEIDEACE